MLRVDLGAVDVVNLELAAGAALLAAVPGAAGDDLRDQFGATRSYTHTAVSRAIIR